MRIVIDLQGAQSASRHRGIGRYSLALAQGLARNRGGHEVLLALNGLFPETIEPIREAFRDVLPPENIRVWTAPGPVAFPDPANDGRRDAAECLREAFLSALEPDIVLVTSLFEGWVDDAAGSVARHACLPTAVVLYDLIPLLHRQLYLSNPTVERWYMEKLEHLKRADLLLAISASSGREAVEQLGFDQNRVVNISTACEPYFQPRQVTEDLRRRLQSAYGIERPFVMYTGGIDHRKNIEGLIRAYARLPAVLRPAHQLVVVCAAQVPERERLVQLAGAAGLAQGDLVLTGYVPDDDLVTLYNACKLFVFPSWHEGFGLPALEAMQCGKAVIAANTSSLPEVVGRADALFDPRDEADMAAKLRRVLEDEDWRQALERHGLEQARRFSWDATARRAVEAMERLHTERRRSTAAAGLPQSPPENRPRLAYVSPLPPERSGIADYSAELLRELTRWYEVEVIIDQSAVADDWIVQHCAVRDVAWFRTHHRRYERVLYHFGNSPFHRHMFDLLAEIPGVVVLHDFFLAHIQAQREVMGGAPQAWVRALQAGHGYSALLERYTAPDTADVVWAYPCNLPVLQQDLGVIVHSEHPRALAKAWYGEEAARAWQVIPHLRAPAGAASRQAAREALGLRPNDFLICSFGLLGPTKLNQRMFDAFAQSPLAEDPAVHLVFVGENHGGAYGQQLLDSIRQAGLQHRVRITGRADAETFRQYLSAADLAVQLRTLSRGETSGTVLDCMNHGLATVVNAHGSLAELDPETVWMLPDDFKDVELAEALTSLWRDAGRRQALGGKAQAVIRARHDPAACAAQYASAIEAIYRNAQQGVLGLLHRWADHPPASVDEGKLAQTLALNFPPEPRRRQLLVDVSTLAQVDAGTGVQRVTRTILREWLLHPPAGWSVEPVHATPDVPGYRYARRFSSRFLGFDDAWAEDAPVDAWAGDVFVGLDLAAHLVPQREAFFADLRGRGVAIVFVVYDLLPVLRPDWFPDGLPPHFPPWLRSIARVADGLVCISRAVAEELQSWLDAEQPQRQRPLILGYFHLGANIDSRSTGLPAVAEGSIAAPSEDDLVASATAHASNRYVCPLPERINWRIEGPFDSSYSLALLNRETARALRDLGHYVVLHSTEGPGDFTPSASFLRANPDLAELHARAAATSHLDVNVTSRNLYPPRVADMASRLNLLHHYAWEESGFPADWAEDFSKYLDGVTCLSNHVQKILMDCGVEARLSVSGCGVDHWERIQPDAAYKVAGRSFRFLHVSSCFPRKGADVLLKAYGASFTNRDDVTLIIKTFDNPHNEIAKWLVEAKDKRSDFPHVLIIKDDLSDAQLKALYEQCHAFVAPSRAEGFGLPMAEAMLSGLPVITTGWGGQLDFCNYETAWLIDYSFTYARTHFGLFDSVWVEPDADHLASLMRDVYALPPKDRRNRAMRGRDLLLKRFRWTDVAERLVASARSWAQTPPAPPPRIGWVTSWNTRCGIATYSAHLVNNMPAGISIFASHTDSQAEPDGGNVRRCWHQGEADDLEELGRAVEAQGIDTLVVQFNYGFFNFEHFGAFLDRQVDAGRKVVVMLHSTTDPANCEKKRLTQLRSSLARCARLLVHAPADLNRLKSIGLVENVALFPHGVLDYAPPPKKGGSSFLIASYGFFLPPNGLLELIDSVAFLREQGMNIKLRMVNAAYPIPESRALVEAAKSKIVQMSLQPHIEMITDYLSDEESLALLSEADLIVFPYQMTGESSSAAVRYGLASGRPVAVTPLPIFDDVSTAVFRLPGTTAADIARGIADIAHAIKNDTAEMRRKAEQAERWRSAHRYSHLGRRLNGMLVALRSTPAGSTGSGMGLPGGAGETLRRLRSTPAFLMVGTIEPRKGHAQTLAAFERLWDKGHDVNLAIVGKQGWLVEALVERLRRNPEAGRRLFWLQGISDEYLEQIYAASTCLIAASLAEGFGLPLIEAAQHKLPIIARDLPVFREVAGDHAFYFRGDKPEELADAILQWLSLHAEGNAPKSDAMRWLTWQQSAKTLETLLMNESHPQWTHVWQPGHRWRLRAADPRFHSQVGRRTHEGVQSQGSAGYLLYGPYIEVPAGNYELSLYGRAGTQGVDGATVDVCAARGEQVLAKAPLQSDGLGIGQDTELARLAFRTERATTDLETRVWTSEASSLTVTRVEFTPVAGSESDVR